MKVFEIGHFPYGPLCKDIKPPSLLYDIVSSLYIRVIKIFAQNYHFPFSLFQQCGIFIIEMER